MADISNSEWISVDDELPEPWEDVLVYAQWEGFTELRSVSYYGCGIKIGWLGSEGWHIDGKLNAIVSHWMHLPKRPKLDGEE